MLTLHVDNGFRRTGVPKNSVPRDVTGKCVMRDTKTSTRRIGMPIGTKDAMGGKRGILSVHPAIPGTLGTESGNVDGDN